jgi:hypothetical protein
MKLLKAGQVGFGFISYALLRHLKNPYLLMPNPKHVSFHRPTASSGSLKSIAYGLLP